MPASCSAWVGVRHSIRTVCRSLFAIPWLWWCTEHLSRGLWLSPAMAASTMHRPVSSTTSYCMSACTMSPSIQTAAFITHLIALHAKCCDEPVCLYARISRKPLRQIFCACWQWPWLRPAGVAIRYVGRYLRLQHCMQPCSRSHSLTTHSRTDLAKMLNSRVDYGPVSLILTTNHILTMPSGPHPCVQGIRIVLLSICRMRYDVRVMIWL